MRIIACTAESEVFKYERLLDKSWMEKFQGASWIPILSNKLNNYRFTSTDVALSHVNNGFWDASDIGVIQHLNHPDAKRLIELGAKPLVLLAMESPIYATSFLKNINSIASKFPKRVMLEGLIDCVPVEEKKNYILRFPSFSNDNILPIKPWNDRLFMTMVVRNMYGNSLSFKYLKHPLDIARWLFRLIKLFNVETLIEKKKFKYYSLHDKRIEAIIYFGELNCLDLFGHGWNSLKNLPKYYQNKLKPVLRKINPVPVDNKISTINNYKFALCYENASYKGGVSEKIIDCFVGGVIPVYLGATNIEEFIPTDAFIDVRKYNSFNILQNKLESISETEANFILKSGRDFLYSKEGQTHSYEGFATLIKDLILEEIND